MAEKKLNQKKTFESEEGDHFFERNKDKLVEHTDSIVDLLKSTIKPKKVLEIGCSNGWRLNCIQRFFKSECYGIDPSKKAIQSGKKMYPTLNLKTGTADKLHYKNNFFDTIIFGFCLYLCDRNDLFKISYETDRCLQNKGNLIILDFDPTFAYKNKYAHKDGIYSYKMDYSKMFTWNPQYVEIARLVSTSSGFEGIDNPDEKIATIALRKNNQFAYPDSPFGKK